MQTNGLIGSPRAIAAYLTTLKPALARATSSRQGWVRDIGVLLEDARQQHTAIVASSAARVERAQLILFREVQREIGPLPQTPDCEALHRAVTSWLDRQIGACELMVDVGLRGDLSRLKEVQGLLAEGRFHARTFNDEYARLVAMIRFIARDARGARTPNANRRATRSRTRG